MRRALQSRNRPLDSLGLKCPPNGLTIVLAPPPRATLKAKRERIDDERATNNTFADNSGKPGTAQVGAHGGSKGCSHVRRECYCLVLDSARRIKHEKHRETGFEPSGLSLYRIAQRQPAIWGEDLRLSGIREHNAGHGLKAR